MLEKTTAPRRRKVAKSTTVATVEQTIAIIQAALEEKKGEDIVTLHLPEGTGVADAFIIASGTSERHTQTLAENAADALAKAGCPVYGMEGTPANRWVLLDAGPVLVHVFIPEARDMYKLEKLWGTPDTPATEPTSKPATKA